MYIYNCSNKMYLICSAQMVSYKNRNDGLIKQFFIYFSKPNSMHPPKYGHSTKVPSIVLSVNASEVLV